MALKKLPIGKSTLSNIINDGYIYIDKTPFIENLVDRGTYYFLSRPRRFGKSLFLDTLKQAFLGNKALFTGLHLENNWDWSMQYPVIHISFAGEVHDVGLLEQNMHNILDRIIKQYFLNEILSEPLLNTKLLLLIEALSAKFNQQVVILVDEYDKPILDNIEHLENAGYARTLLKSLYSVIKDCDKDLKFVFFTGVTKFAKSGIFSNLNNLNDITLDAQYADLCGYTQHDIETKFKSHLSGVDMQELKRWYNGYNFLGLESQKVYNPFDILLFISKGKQYDNYWFETGTPTFLIKLLQKNRYYLPDVEGMQVTNSVLSSFDIDNLSIEVLLLQAGYLTIHQSISNPFDNTVSYQLGYPNHEVRTSLTASLMNYFYNDKGVLSNTQPKIIQALLERDFVLLQKVLHAFFAGIPYNWYVNNNIAEYEGFYSTVLYCLFNSLGVVTIPEDATNKGRIDLTLDVLTYKIIMEFKTIDNGSAQSALEQIITKHYADKYLHENKPIFLMGISFDKDKRNIGDLVWKEVER